MNKSLGSFHTKSFETKSQSEYLELRAVKNRLLHCAAPEINCRITSATSLVHLRCCTRSPDDTNILSCSLSHQCCIKVHSTPVRAHVSLDEV